MLLNFTCKKESEAKMKFPSDVPTNDFDLTPDKTKTTKNKNEKRGVPLSTIKRQIKDCKKLLEEAKELGNIDIVNSFDGLKMWVDLRENGDLINFQLQNMEETLYPTTAPNPIITSLEKLSAFKAQENLANVESKLEFDDKDIVKELFDFENDEEEEDGLDFEITEDDADSELPISNSGSNRYPNSKIPHDIYIKNLGIVNIYIKDDILVIWVTGKIMAEEGALGLITRDNIRECLHRIINLHLFSFDIEAFIEVAGCYIVDNTIDLLFDSELQTTRMINAISSFLPIMSKEYYSQKYKRNGLLIRKRAAKAGYSLAIYCKGEELRHSLKTQNRATLYTNRIGETGQDIANRTLRLELHMKKFAVIREFLAIPNQERLFVPLRDILDSVAIPILTILYKLGIDEDKLLKHLTWYEPIAEKSKKNESLSEQEFKDLLVAERITELIKDNDFNTAITKAHLSTEYNLAPQSKTISQMIPTIKTNMYRFLCFRKPKSITTVLNLLSMIYETYKS